MLIMKALFKKLIITSFVRLDKSSVKLKILK